MNKTNIFYYLCLIFVMLLWGFNLVAVKVLVQLFPPLTMTSARIFVAGLLVWLFLNFRSGIKKPTGEEWFYIIAASLSGVFAHHLFLTLGLLHTTASNTAIIIALAPLATTLFAAFFINERLTAMKIIGIIMGLFGVYLVVFQGSMNFLLVSIGDIYVFGAMLAQAISYIFIKKATETIDSKQITGIMFLIGSVFLLVFGMIVEPGGIKQFTSNSIAYFYWLLFLASAVIATGLGHLLYNASIHQLGASRTSIFLNFVPFFGLIGSALFLKETITMIQISGFLLIVFGVICGVLEKLRGRRINGVNSRYRIKRYIVPRS